MKKERHLKIFNGLMLSIGVFMILGGCSEQPRRAGDYTGMMKKAPGYTYVLGAMTGRGIDTPPYIPGKIKFELEIYLNEKGLLASSSQSENRLTVAVESEVNYSMQIVNPSRADSGAYQELISNVKVTDARTGDKIGEAVFRSYNGFGESTSDFTEREHAKDIAGFLETIVR